MPTYLLHGFRWIRAGITGIRAFIALHNMDDASAEYIQNAPTTQSLINTFQELYPEIMKRIPSSSSLQFIEQHDPEDLSSEAAVSQPYAYVADRVVTIDHMKKGFDIDIDGISQLLDIDLEELVASSSTDNDTAMAELRDKLCPAGGEKQKIGWYLVYNGDPDRAYPHEDVESTDEEEEKEKEEYYAAYGEGHGDNTNDNNSSAEPVNNAATTSTVSQLQTSCLFVAVLMQLF